MLADRLGKWKMSCCSENTVRIAEINIENECTAYLPELKDLKYFAWCLNTDIAVANAHVNDVVLGQGQRHLEVCVSRINMASQPVQ